MLEKSYCFNCGCVCARLERNCCGDSPRSAAPNAYMRIFGVYGALAIGARALFIRELPIPLNKLFILFPHFFDGVAGVDATLADVGFNNCLISSLNSSKSFRVK